MEGNLWLPADMDGCVCCYSSGVLYFVIPLEAERYK